MLPGRCLTLRCPCESGTALHSPWDTSSDSAFAQALLATALLLLRSPRGKGAEHNSPRFKASGWPRDATQNSPR
jgi:hypothetical protein